MAAFTFSTYAQYKASRDNISTAGTIGKTLADAAPSASCVSFVTESGKTYIDSVNTIVDVKSGGIADLLVWKDSTYYWVKTGKVTSSDQYGITYHNIEKLNAAGYTAIGYMGYKKGRECLLISTVNVGPSTWGDSTTVSGCATFGSVTRADGFTSCPILSVCQEAAEIYAKANNDYYLYTYPLSRAYWVACKDAYNRGDANAPTGSNGMSCSFGAYNSSGVRSCAISYNAVYNASWNTKQYTCNPIEYNWDWDKWYKRNILVYLPAYNCAASDLQGKRNTKAIVDKFPSGSYAANLAYNYRVRVLNASSGNDQTDFGVNKWWLGSFGEHALILSNYKQLSRKNAWNTTALYWTSTQRDSSNSWRIGMGVGISVGEAKSNSYYVRAVSAFQIPN